MSRTLRVGHAPKRENGRRSGLAEQRHIFVANVVFFALLVVVAVGIFSVHWPVLSAKAVSFDEVQYLFESPVLNQPSWASAGRIFREVFQSNLVNGYYEPLTLLTLMFDIAAGGTQDNLAPFHRTSLLLHVANTLLIMVLLYRLCGQPWIAALVALLFGLHPLTIEPVAWVWERKTLLATFFALCSLLLYVRYARGTSHPGLKPVNRTVAYLLCLGAFFLALLSKPTTVPLPALLILLDIWPLRRLTQRSLLEKIPFFALAAVSAVVTIISTRENASVRVPAEQGGAEMLLRVCFLIAFYFGKIAWPTDLSWAYQIPSPMTLGQTSVIVAVAALCLLVGAAALLLRRTRAPMIGLLFFVLAIFPTLGLIRYSWVSASDRYVYWPMVGLLVVLAGGLSRLWNLREDSPTTSVRRISVVAILLLIAASEAFATRYYLAFWQDTEHLARRMVAMSPNVPQAYCLLGETMIRQNRLDEAIPALKEALRIQPDNAEVHTSLGAALHNKGLIRESMLHYTEALRADPRCAKAHNNIGLALFQLQKLDEAIVEFTASLELNPDYLDARQNYGAALIAKGRKQEAVEQFGRLLKCRKHNAIAHHGMALALAGCGRVDEAIMHFGEVLRAKPDNLDAHYDLACILANCGRIDDAIREYREVLRLNPNHPQAGVELASVSRKKGPR